MRRAAPRPPIRATVLAGALLAGACRHPAAPAPPADTPLPEPEPAAVHPLAVGLRREVPGLLALACEADRCASLDPDGLTRFDPQDLAPSGPPLVLPFPADALEARDGAFFVEGPCRDGARCRLRIAPDLAQPPGAAVEIAGVSTAMDPIPQAQGPGAERERWAEILGHDRRIPFARRVPVQGGTLTYRRDPGPAGGVLVRVGAGIRLAEAPAPGSPITCEGWLAPHPSGRLALLLLWPLPVLGAYEAETLERAWSLALPGPAQGLFVDPAGRFALLAETEPWDQTRLTDHPAPPLPAPAADGPLEGWAALPPDGPRPVAALLVDLGGPAVVARVEGAFRAWVRAPGGAWLLATDRAVLRLAPP